MDNKNDLTNIKYELLDIFSKEEDKIGTDLLNMTNFFDVYITKINSNLNCSAQWTNVPNINNYYGMIAAAIKGKVDIAASKILIADSSHFSKEIIKGLASGLYHIGESKEVFGNLRPAILDKKERAVKFFTLKKAINPTELLSDISNYSMQVTLQKITMKLDEIGTAIIDLTEFERREKLSNKFLYARDRILFAVNSSNTQQEQYLSEADTYLMEGLSDLYADLNAEIKKLSGLKGPLNSINKVDTYLSHINEDLQMIPRYVALRVYLLNLRQKSMDANRILNEFRQRLELLSERKIENSNYTAIELIHKYYPYTEDNMDFWLKQPKQTLQILNSFKLLDNQQPIEVLYVDIEEPVNE